MAPDPAADRAAAARDLPTWPFPPDDPYPAYREMREAGGVQWSHAMGAWLVLSYAEAIDVLLGPDWSADVTRNPELLARIGGGARGEGLFPKMLLFTDPPEHDKLRRAVNRFFTPRRVQTLQDRIASTVAAALAPPRREIELMDEVAYPVPLAVICELLDVGIDTAGLLRKETPTMAAMLDLLAPPEVQAQAASAALALMLALVPIAAERQQEPGDDLLTALLEALPPDESIVMALLLLAAGHETTSNLIGNGTLALAQHPDQRELLERRPDLLPGAVEELLRWDSPVQVTGRVARSDTHLGGQRIGKGEQAIVLIGAANRDPATFNEPDRLDITRTGPGHLAFGHGAHYCVGAALARAEATAVFVGLLARRYRIEEWERTPSSTFRRLQRVTMRCAPRG